LRKKIIADANEQLASLQSTGAMSSLLIEEINKSMGQIAYSLGEEEAPSDIKELVSTGSTVLDTIISNDLPEILGLPNGGLPPGRIVEIHGDSSTGKSLIGNHILINTQKMGGIPILFDEENAISIEFLKRMGMKIGQEARDAGLSNLVYLQAGTCEDVFDTMEKIIMKMRDLNSDKLITIVWDSVASTPTKEEVEKGYDEKTMAVKARVLSLGLRKLTAILGKQRVLLVFINQVRAKFGVMFGDPTTTTGGFAIPFHSSVRIKLYKNGEIKDKSGAAMGVGVKAKVIKNRLSAPGRQAEFCVYFAKGIDDLESNFNALVKIEIIKKPTTQSYELDFNGQILKFKTTQWREKVLETPGLEDWIKQQVRKHMVLNLVDPSIPLDETGSVILSQGDSELDV
jgi:recombination protein RecA